MAKAAVVLSGCGYLDGAEIHESVFSLYFLDRAGIQVQCFAPDKEQVHVVDHRSGKVVPGATRNVLVEAARIARGHVLDLAQLSMAGFDALVLPGGYGVAKNLSNFALTGARARVDSDLSRVVGDTVDQKKPIVAICISPAVLAAALKSKGLSANLTIGNDEATASAISELGSTHQPCRVDKIVIDERHRIISTPAYMLGPNPKDVAAGIEAAIGQLALWLEK